ncbi:angiotensin-converting enzyme isoform X2 [Bradysia coprophila]|nr:angiotensin-converting enzyme isoform X2 [Bradysia coprophila]
MLPKVCVLFILMNVKLIFCEPVPQLDLPPLDVVITAKPEVTLNSYTEDKGADRSEGVSSDFDRDRSQRFGPPYAYNNQFENRSATRGFEDINYNRNRPFLDDDKYYANRNRDDFNGNLDPDRFRNSNYRDGYQYQRPNPNGYNDDQYNYNNGYQQDERYRLEQERQFRIEDDRLRRILAEIDQKSSFECSLNVAAQWNFETNVNEITQVEALAAQQRYSDYQRTVWDQMRQIDKNRIYDQQLFRQVYFMSNIGPSALPPDQLDRYNRLINDMLAIYNKAEICGYEQPFNCGLRLQPHLKELMGKSRDWEELQYTWTEWRRKSGRDMRDLYEQVAELTNEAARYNNFSSAADYWTFPFESPDFRRDAENVWLEILPLYELIHAYVRRKLREFYGPDRINKNAPLPDHVLGNMYGQSWSNILDITIPYPGRSFLEVTPQMAAQGYTPHVMFQLAEEFFLSMNMTVLPTEFWIDSILERPPDRAVICQPSAWDFCNGHDYRIKMCTGVNHKDLITVHHEMAHIHYFINYRHKPKVFRDGANAAFHEAIGDAIALSAATPKHLQTLGLIQKSVDDTAHDVNFLFALALDKVVFLPFALSLDAWRWDIFNKKITKEQYNCHWWLLREKYGGIKPPVLRSEMDFDPGSKYHVPANIPYIRYFFATVLQFQIHRALCKASLQYLPGDSSKPLHKCDIYRQPEAGNTLK